MKEDTYLVLEGQASLRYIISYSNKMYHITNKLW